MLSFLKPLGMFFREILYDTKDEYNYTSFKFNSRKAVVFCVFILLSLVSCNMVKHAYRLAKENIRLQEHQEKHVGDCKIQGSDPSDSGNAKPEVKKKTGA